MKSLNNFKILWKVDFLKNVEAKDILSPYVKPNETIVINKFQRSRQTFDLSAKVAHFGVLSKY